MGKGSRVREEKAANGQNETGAVKLSKKQIIRLQEKKKKTKKILTWSITAVVAIAVVVAIIITSIPNVPNLEAQLVGKNEYFEMDGAMFAYVVYEYVNQYASTMSYYGYDTSLGLLSQTTQYTSGSTSMTWYKYFCQLAESQMAQYIALASAAKAEGMTITEEDQKEIDDYMKSLKDYAYSSGYGGTNKFLDAAYTPGVTAGAVRRYLEIEALARNYAEKFIDSLEYTDEEIDKYRQDNPGSFKKIDYVSYDFKATYIKDATTEQKNEAYAKAKAEAEAFLAANKTVESFKESIYALEKAKEEEESSTTTAKSTGDDITEKNEILEDFITTGEFYDEDDAEADATKDYFAWAYSDERKANDTYILEIKASNGDLSYRVFIIEKPVYIDEYASQDVRHILFDIDTTLTGSALEKALAKAKEEAQKVLDEYNKGDKTAEAFGELAKEHTADGNGDEGGLYENVLKGSMVEEFENWIYDDARKAGDVDLVKTKYGWHIMYYVGEGNTAWKVTAEEGLKNDDYEDHLEDLEEKYGLEYDYEAMFISLGGEM